MVAFAGTPDLPVPVQEAKVEPAPRTPPLVVRIDDTAQPHALVGFFGCVSIPLFACLGVIGYEALTGTDQELVFRQAYLLGSMAAMGFPVAYLGLNALAANARARFETAKPE
jgi:hypothetical protein